MSLHVFVSISEQGQGDRWDVPSSNDILTYIFPPYAFGKVCGGMKNVFKYCRSLGISVERRLKEGIVVSTALYGTETWNMEAAQRRRLNAS